MVATAAAGVAAKAGPAILSAAKGLGSKLGGFFKNSGSGILDNLSNGSGILNAFNQSNLDTETAKAYQAYLNGIIENIGSALENRAEKYDTKLQDMSKEAEPQFLAEANTQLPELGQLVQDISDEAAESQRQNRKQVQAELAQQGVRGGQAAILANRATGELNRDLQRDINKSVYDEALNRQNSRLGYFSQKAITPWSQRAGAYSSSLSGANNALSNAQGNVYQDAYTNAMNNYTNTKSRKKFGLF